MPAPKSPATMPPSIVRRVLLELIFRANSLEPNFRDN